MKLLCLLLLGSSIAFGEVHRLSLQQALTIAKRQNSDILLARLDVERARHDVEIAGDAFSPKVQLRSDPVYTNGYPNSIGSDNSSPALLGQRTDMALFNRPKHYQVAAAKQDVVTAALGPRAKADSVAHRIASLYLDVEGNRKETEALQAQLASYRKMESVSAARVRQGYALPVEETRSRVASARILEQLHAAEAETIYEESLIAATLGFSGNDRVEPGEGKNAFVLPSFKSESEAVDVALLNNKDLLRLQSDMLAKQMESKSSKSARLPQFDLVEQYALFAERTYQDYFPSNTFQRNNAQIGASFSVPILVGLEPGARLEQADIDERKIQVQMDDLGRRIRAGVRHGYGEMEKAQSALDLARQQLDLTRDEATVLNAQYSEGRSSFSDVQQAMNDGIEKQITVFQQEIALERAKLSLLEQLEDLMTALAGNR